jgi:PIF1 helicase.
MLLLGGNIAHSQSKIPIDLAECLTCNITKQSPMTHRFAFEAFDLTLQDLRNSQEPMGRIVTILCGDFRQILPIIQEYSRSRADIIHATLKNSTLWKHVKDMTLHKNMRLNTNSSDWDKILLQIGNGQYPSINIDDEECIQLPDNLLLDSNQTVEDLIFSVYDGPHDTFQVGFQDKAILTPHK